MKSKNKNKTKKSPRERYNLGSFVTQNAEVANQYQSQINSLVRPEEGSTGKAAVSGLASGASLGTAILPGWGTAIGAVVGGIGGFLFGGAKERREKEAYSDQIRQLSSARSNITQDLYLSSLNTNNDNPYGTYANGGDILPNLNPVINIEKGELQVNSNNGKILREYTGINPETGGKYELHNKKGKDTNNNMVTAEEGTFIITKKEAAKYKEAVENNDKLYQNTIMSNIRNQKNKQTIDKYQDGGKVMSFDQFTKYYDKDPNDKLYNIKQAYSIYKNNPSKFEDPEIGIASKESDGWHFSSVDPNTNIFLKHKKHPTVNKELNWYNSNEGSDFRSKFDLDSTQNYYRYIPKNNKYAEGGIVDPNILANLSMSGVNANTNFNIPKLNPNAINFNRSVSNISPGFNWGGAGNIASTALNYLPSLYNIAQGSRRANTMPYTPIRINPQARQNILANLPREISANPALNNIRSARTRAYSGINANTSNPTVARANRLALEGTFLDAENQALYNNELTNNQIRGQRANILAGLDAQDQGRTAQNVQLLNNTLLTNAQMQQAKVQQLNYGISQFGQMYQNNRRNRQLADMDQRTLQLLQQIFPNTGNLYDSWRGGNS